MPISKKNNTLLAWISIFVALLSIIFFTIFLFIVPNISNYKNQIETTCIATNKIEIPSTCCGDIFIQRDKCKFIDCSYLLKNKIQGYCNVNNYSDQKYCDLYEISCYQCNVITVLVNYTLDITYSTNITYTCNIYDTNCMTKFSDPVSCYYLKRELLIYLEKIPLNQNTYIQISFVISLAFIFTLLILSFHNIYY